MDIILLNASSKKICLLTIITSTTTKVHPIIIINWHNIITKYPSLTRSMRSYFVNLYGKPMLKEWKFINHIKILTKKKRFLNSILNYQNNNWFQVKISTNNHNVIQTIINNHHLKTIKLILTLSKSMIH